jgi:hypothetical protein
VARCQKQFCIAHSSPAPRTGASFAFLNGHESRNCEEGSDTRGTQRYTTTQTTATRTVTRGIATDRLTYTHARSRLKSHTHTLTHAHTHTRTPTPTPTHMHKIHKHSQYKDKTSSCPYCTRIQRLINSDRPSDHTNLTHITHPHHCECLFSTEPPISANAVVIIVVVA